MPGDLPTGTVTFLFTDIEGSTRLLQELGDGYADVLEHGQVLRAAFERHGGTRSMRKATRSSPSFRAQGSRRRGSRGTARLEVPSMGLHTGEAVIAPTGYVGMDVHRAARICSAAHGGQVLVSQTTRDLVTSELPDELDLRDIGEHRLKDLAEPLSLHQLVIAGLPSEFPPLRTRSRGI